MPAVLSPSAKQQFFTNAGEPAAGYRLYIFAANTSTPAVTFTDRAASVENQFPIILDARGEAIIYLTPGVVYDYVLKTEDDALVWTREDVFADADSSARITLKGFGAVGDGVADDSAATQRALDYAKTVDGEVWATAGTYLINTTVTLSDAHIRLRGEGVGQTNFKRTADAASSAMLVFTNCSRMGVYGIGFDGAGMTQGSGLKFDGGTVSVIEVKDCQFANFPGSGLYMDGSAVTPGSSCTIENNLFLSNGIIQTRPQLEAHYINDTFWIANQFGAHDLDGPYPPQGILLLNCKAGNYERNYHWENLIGGQYDACDYTRFVGNRWETNEREGCKFYNSILLTIVGNHVHTVSMESSGTYSGMSFDTCSHVQVNSNEFFTWDGGVLTSYALRLAVDCHDFTVADNRFYGWATGPVFFSTASANMKFVDNFPAGYMLSQSTGAWLPFSSLTTVPVGTTAYLGSAGQSATAGHVVFVAPRAGSITKMRVATTNAPGVGQTYTYTLQRNLVDTGLTFQITGAGVFSGVVTGNIAIVEGDLIGVKCVTSAAVGVAAHMGMLVFDE